MDFKKHWENIYNTKSLREVSWYQPVPQLSLDLIAEYDLAMDAVVADVGGGDSFLADNLLNLGFENLKVVDISKKALERGANRLGDNARKINWICADIVDWKPESKIDLWHDRAAFHFLTDKNQVQQYVDLVFKSLSPEGKIILATFAKEGPLKCSGIEIQQYDAVDLQALFSDQFQLKKELSYEHPTPFGTTQKFTYVCLERK